MLSTSSCMFHSWMRKPTRRGRWFVNSTAEVHPVGLRIGFGSRLGRLVQYADPTRDSGILSFWCVFNHTQAMQTP